MATMTKLPIDLKHYRAPRWYDRAVVWTKHYWHWFAIAGYFGLVYFAY